MYPEMKAKFQEKTWHWEQYLAATVIEMPLLSWCVTCCEPWVDVKSGARLVSAVPESPHLQGKLQHLPFTAHRRSWRMECFLIKLACGKSPSLFHLIAIWAHAVMTLQDFSTKLRGHAKYQNCLQQFWAALGSILCGKWKGMPPNLNWTKQSYR